jgi:ankyrin repeat protein
MINKYNQFINESVRDLMKPKSEEEIKLALKDSDINKEDGFGYSKLMVAAWKRDWDMVEFLIDNGADINNVDSNGQTILFVACADGNLDMVKYLIEKGINYNIEDSEGNSAIILAQYNEHTEVVDYLKSLRKPSLLKSLLKTNESVRDLMKPKSEKELIELYGKLTPEEELLKGTINYLPWVVKHALERGANPNEKYSKGVTVLMYAITENDIEMMKILLDYGADPTIENQYGMTALRMWETWKGNKEMMDLLDKYKSMTNESVRDLMKPKSEEELDKIWKVYYDTKQLLQDKYPTWASNTYEVTKDGKILINWKIIGKTYGNDKIEEIRIDIMNILKAKGIQTMYDRFGNKETFRRR